MSPAKKSVNKLGGAQKSWIAKSREQKSARQARTTATCAEGSVPISASHGYLPMLVFASVQGLISSSGLHLSASVLGHAGPSELGYDVRWHTSQGV